MDSVIVSFVSAMWLGILTSISPCPLATNIAAVSYIGRRLDRSTLVFGSGLLYTLGRTIAYVGLGAAVVFGVSSVPEMSRFLQKYMNQFIGPVLIVVGMFLLDLIRISGTGSRFAERFQNRVAAMGVWGALPLGVLFALSFCPVSAALFFGSLIPLALERDSALLLPAVYGIGTALPVMIVAVVIALSAQALGRVFRHLTRIDKWARLVTGITLIVVGIYLSLLYIFRIQIL